MSADYTIEAMIRNDTNVFISVSYRRQMPFLLGFPKEDLTEVIFKLQALLPPLVIGDIK